MAVGDNGFFTASQPSEWVDLCKCQVLRQNCAWVSLVFHVFHSSKMVPDHAAQISLPFRLPKFMSSGTCFKFQVISCSQCACIHQTCPSPTAPTILNAALALNGGIYL